MSRVLKAWLTHEKALKRYLRRYLKRPQDIEDVAQETFLRAFAAESRNPVSSPRAFLFRVARNTALHEVERKVNSATELVADCDDPAVFPEESSETAEERLDTRRRLVIFTRAVASMPPRCQQVFLLRKVEGLKVREIATRLEITVSAVEKHVAAGLVHCSRFFREQGYDPAELGPVAERYGSHRGALSGKSPQRVK